MSVMIVTMAVMVVTMSVMIVTMAVMVVIMVIMMVVLMGASRVGALPRLMRPVCVLRALCVGVRRSRPGRRRRVGMAACIVSMCLYMRVLHITGCLRHRSGVSMGRRRAGRLLAARFA